VVGPEEGLGPVDRQLLDDVDELLALVVALPGVPLGVLVGQDRPGRLHDRLGDVVLGRDEADLLRLAAPFGFDGLLDLGVDGRERRGEGLVGVGHAMLLADRHDLARRPGRWP
jgi:hypothetical protein